MIQAHQIMIGVCIHCEAVNPSSDATCVLREGIVVLDGPRIAAVNDFDFISARIAELKRQKDISK